MGVHRKLDDLYRLHIAAIHLTHGVRAETHGWQGFPPSKFIYAFFTFNSVYSINWQDTFCRGIVTDWGSVNADVILTP